MLSKIETGTKIKQGEFVKLKQEYTNAYPAIPPTVALKIEDIQHDEAMVVYINFKANKICREKIPVAVISNEL
jgi:hypothetical protein